MNATDVLRYGHLTLLGTIERASDDIVGAPGACGTWSIKDIVSHLASYEAVLVDILGTAIEPGPTSVLDRFRNPDADFNDLEVAGRASRSMDDVLAELNDTHARTLDQIAGIDPKTLRQPGTIAWYGPDYALDDLLVYMYYGHKREHSAQIESFRDRHGPDH